MIFNLPRFRPSLEFNESGHSENRSHGSKNRVILTQNLDLRQGRENQLECAAFDGFNRGVKTGSFPKGPLAQNRMIL